MTDVTIMLMLLYPVIYGLYINITKNKDKFIVLNNNLALNDSCQPKSTKKTTFIIKIVFLVVLVILLPTTIYEVILNGEYY